MAGITGRLLTGEENIANCLKIETDFESVHKKLEGIRQKSYQYLLSALKDEGSRMSSMILCGSILETILLDWLSELENTNYFVDDDNMHINLYGVIRRLKEIYND